MMKYNRYDASYKMAAIQEYYEKNAAEGISIREFAVSKNISHSTFYQWLKIFEEESAKQNETSDTEEICLSSLDGLPSSFIRISEDHDTQTADTALISYEEQCPSKSMKLFYKDMAIEFDKEDLPFLLRSIRQ